MDITRTILPLEHYGSPEIVSFRGLPGGDSKDHFALIFPSRHGAAEGVRFLLLAAKPLREPVVQYGPFVMNTREEIEQALADYRDGRLAAAA